MPERTYDYKIRGKSAEGTEWETSGRLRCPLGDVLRQALVASFADLTNGRAQYGQPGVGCRGPYEIISLSFEKVEN